MTYKKLDAIKQFTTQPFQDIGSDWVLISAIKDGVVNTMTASWGAVGVIWNKYVATIYIRPQRYTKEFVDHSDYFTITFFDSHKRELSVLGTKSGRDGDKIKEVGFTTIMIDNQPTFEQGRTVMICRKLYADTIKEECFIDPTINQTIYPNHDQHMMYIAEIESIYVK